MNKSFYEEIVKLKRILRRGWVIRNVGYNNRRVS